METSTHSGGHQQHNFFDDQLGEGLGSDRLRKAIERNRAKRAKREGKSLGGKTRGRTVSTTSIPVDHSWQPPGGSGNVTRATRKTVARPEDVEFTDALRPSRSSSATKVKYPVAKTKSTRRTTRAKTKKSKLVKDTQAYLIKGLWVFCAILLLRLVFSQGGVMDFYSKKDVFRQKERELESLKMENAGLLKEIERIRKDPRFQKKLVRDHLGYIAEDEYLVLFPKKEVQMRTSPTFSSRTN